MPGRIKNFFDSILFRISVPRCVCCKRALAADSRALCPECLKDYNEAKTRSCSQCSRVLPECTCPNYYLKCHFVSSLSKLVRYDYSGRTKSASRMIFKMKNKRRDDVIDFVSEELTESLLISNPSLPADTIVTNVPNRKSAIRSRGFDHAEVLARAVAKKLGLEYMSLLVSEAKLPQKSMKNEDRFKNAKFDLKSEPNIKGRHVIIVDDVVTSGASMGNSASMIRSLGTKKIIGATVAIAYKDEKINTL